MEMNQDLQKVVQFLSEIVRLKKSVDEIEKLYKRKSKTRSMCWKMSESLHLVEQHWYKYPLLEIYLVLKTGGITEANLKFVCRKKSGEMNPADLLDQCLNSHNIIYQYLQQQMSSNRQ
jgi:hypothetical protein